MTTANTEPTATGTAAAETFTREWTETGALLFDAERANREGHNYATGRDAVVTGINGLTWVELPRDGGDLSLPFSPGESLNAVISGLSLRDVRRIAWDGSVAVRDDVEGSRSLYTLLGVEVGERGGLLRLYAVDRGTDVLPVAYDRIPAPKTPAAAETPAETPAEATAGTVATLPITAAELQRGDVVLAADGSRAYAAFDLREEPNEDGTSDVHVWTALADQEAGQPEWIQLKSTDDLMVQRPTA